jgi:spermidine/putrescine transport system permease protein
MAVDTLPAEQTLPTPPSDLEVGRLPLGHRISNWVRSHLVALFAMLALIYLFLPIAVVVVFSFNSTAPNGRGSVAWQGFSTEAWTNICVDPNICRAVGTSLQIGLLATIGGVLLGTLISFALVRHRFRGRQSTNLTIFLPMATPEVVMGASLLTLFLNTRIPLGIATILIAHIMFTISFVVVTVKARLAVLDPRLEQAAMDLYANERETFRYVTLPLVAPGIAAAALLSFSLSFDDFIITYFNKGPSVTTFPVYVWSAAARGVPPQVYVIGTLMFFGALALVVMAQLAGRVRRKA